MYLRMGLLPKGYHNRNQFGRICRKCLTALKKVMKLSVTLVSLEEGMQAEAADRSGDVNGENTETDNAEEGV